MTRRFGTVYDDHSHKHLFAPARMRTSFNFLDRNLISAVDAKKTNCVDAIA